VITETAALDPSEFIDNRVELALDQVGFAIDVEGVDWGEADIAVQLSRQDIGASVTDRHLEPVEMTIPLMVKEEGKVSLAEAANKLEQKIGLLQKEGGWIRRDFDDGAGFAGSVGYQVLKASLSGLQGWLFADQQLADGVKIKILRSPLCYSTQEVEGMLVKGASIRSLQFTLAKVLGTAPGLIRIRVKNEGTKDIRGLIFAAESRDYSSASTAALSYEAEKLTLLGGAKVAERTGASGGKVVRATLSNLWTAFLGSGTMTHSGVRRVLVRVFPTEVLAPGSQQVAPETQLRLEWRELGASQWSRNKIVTSPLLNEWALIDLDECRLDPPAELGEPGWEWRITARSLGTSATIDFDLIWILPVEQMLSLSAPQGLAASDWRRRPAALIRS